MAQRSVYNTLTNATSMSFLGSQSSTDGGLHNRSPLSHELEGSLGDRAVGSSTLFLKTKEGSGAGHSLSRGLWMALFSLGLFPASPLCERSFV